MIGYYIHHHGRGHLARATAIARALDAPITGLSSLPRPADWPGNWVELPLDDADRAVDPRAHGRLHWVPLHSTGLRARGTAISNWISSSQPSVMVVDVSVEVTLLARLHGVPVVVFALAGERRDAAHRLGFDIATSVLATWPPGVTGLDRGLPAEARGKLHAVGAIGRFPPPGEETPAGPASVTPQVLVLRGAGGADGADGEFRGSALTAARGDAEGWSFKHLGGDGEWVSDVWPHLQAATVVVTHAGDGALADVSAARRPTIVIPEGRPHGEQNATARVLGSGLWPVIVLDKWPERGWGALLERARTLDGHAWKWWNDGGGARRASQHIHAVARGEVR
jgi:hypothetical protein